ncbi:MULTISPECIES: hypothetical protein [Burkholderia]|uniref:hypothetical protein n=1 Tax=Burkholderia TaxID=32008 RepID=UPI000DAE23D2|nr:MULTISPECIES: hypothetical protein [Burkholderia]MDP9548668.1 hypothetical protein [Burkholderia cepacia]MBN3502140.1 hypothetical protein [Burkholderia cenocepacia]MBR8394490.1 hypothetical protein [Burkholderia cenocepacia]MBR8473695.1 hypothetical protein [Burkholderia cenocepacia]MBR8491542.1 hypothetical protein [Burkholderia cenocepacia]
MCETIAAARGITHPQLDVRRAADQQQKAAGHFGAGGFFSAMAVRDVGGLRRPWSGRPLDGAPQVRQHAAGRWRAC